MVEVKYDFVARSFHNIFYKNFIVLLWCTVRYSCSYQSDKVKETLLNCIVCVSESCKNVKCRRGKYCVQDQYLNAHCVSCNSTCNNTDHAKVPVCGDNGVTYESICHLESASCYSGRTVTVAYRNKCKSKLRFADLYYKKSKQPTESIEIKNNYNLNIEDKILQKLNQIRKKKTTNK